MWSSGWLSSSSSEPHTLMLNFSFLGRIGGKKKKWRIFVWLLARALMNNCIKIAIKDPQYFFLKPLLKHGILWTIDSSLISWKCISVAKGRVCLFLCSFFFFNLLLYSAAFPATYKCFWKPSYFSHQAARKEMVSGRRACECIWGNQNDMIVIF